MKRILSTVLLALFSLGMLSGCIHLKEFTQEELDRLSYTGDHPEQTLTR